MLLSSKFVVSCRPPLLSITSGGASSNQVGVTNSFKASSQYHARVCVTSRHLRVDARRNARIDSDSILVFLLRCVPASCHEKIAKIWIFSHIASLTQHNARALHHIVNWALGMRVNHHYDWPGETLRFSSLNQQNYSHSTGFMARASGWWLPTSSHFVKLTSTADLKTMAINEVSKLLQRLGPMFIAE